MFIVDPGRRLCDYCVISSWLVVATFPVGGHRRGGTAPVRVEVVFGEYRKKRAAKKVKPGTGKPLKQFRWWHLLFRTLFHLQLPPAGDRADRGAPAPDPAPGTVTYSVDVNYWAGDWDFEAHLYRNGAQHAVSTMPAIFPVEGGEIRVAMGAVGLKRCHYYPDGGSPRQLEPEPRSAEGYRALLQQRRPGLSRALGFASFAVLLVALLLGLPQIAESLTSWEVVSQYTGTFESPLHLPGWANLTLVLASLVAMSERALRLRYNALLDGGDLDFGG